MTQVRRTAAGWFLFHALAVATWWALLWARPALLPYFQAGPGGEDALLAFALPDLAVLAVASVAAAAACRHGGAWLLPTVWMAAGASAYAGLYTFAAAVRADAGWWGVVLMAPSTLLSVVFAVAVTPAAVARFGPSRRASPVHVLARTAAQIVVFWSVLLFLVPALLVEVQGRMGLRLVEWPVGRTAAALAFAALSALGLWSAVVMALRGEGTPLPVDAPRRLVVAGPYAYVRNPMALAGLGQGMAVAAFTGSVLVGAYALLGTAIWQWVARPLEEDDLAARFGDDYAAYRAAVRCWVPRTRPYALDAAPGLADARG